MNNPLKISIVTPSYNQAVFLEKTILSVLGQGYPNLEYIIIDGGSTDGSIDIIRKYEDKLSYWVSEPDNGQTHAINKGFHKATGDIVAWINSDDTYVRGAISKAIQYFFDHPEVDVVYGDCDVIDELGKIISNHKGKNFTLKNAISGDLIYQPATFFKKEILTEIGYLDESLKYSMDYDLWLKAGIKYNIKYIPITLAQFRLHNQSKTVSQSEHFLIDDFKVLDKLLTNNIIDDNALKAAYTRLLQILMNLLRNDIKKFIYCMNYKQSIGITDHDMIMLKNFYQGDISEDTTRQVERILLDIHAQFFKEHRNNNKSCYYNKMASNFIRMQMINIAYHLYDQGNIKKSKLLFQIILSHDVRTLKSLFTLRLILKYLYS